MLFNSLPNHKILDESKSKAFADDKMKVLTKMIFVFDRVENILGKGENDSLPSMLHFPQCLQKAFHSGLLKVRIVW